MPGEQTMAIATLPRKRKKKPQTSVFGIESNGVLMTPEEFDHAEFDELWDYELINGVLIVSPIPLRQEADPNEELGYMLRLYHDSHPKGKSLDFTLGEQYVKT